MTHKMSYDRSCQGMCCLAKERGGANMGEGCSGGSYKALSEEKKGGLSKAQRKCAGNPEPHEVNQRNLKNSWQPLPGDAAISRQLC